MATSARYQAKDKSFALLCCFATRRQAVYSGTVRRRSHSTLLTTLHAPRAAPPATRRSPRSPHRAPPHSTALSSPRSPHSALQAPRTTRRRSTPLHSAHHAPCTVRHRSHRTPLGTLPAPRAVAPTHSAHHATRTTRRPSHCTPLALRPSRRVTAYQRVYQRFKGSLPQRESFFMRN